MTFPPQNPPQNPPQHPHQPPQQPPEPAGQPGQPGPGWSHGASTQQWPGQHAPQQPQHQHQHPQQQQPPQQRSQQGQAPQYYPPQQQPAYPPQPYPPHQQPPHQQPYQQPPHQQQPNQQQPNQAPTPQQGYVPRPEHAAGGRSRWRPEPIALVAVATLVVGLVLGWLVGRQTSGPDTLDPSRVEAGVTTVLSNDYGVANVSHMACPNHMLVQKNATYTCTFLSGSAKGSVDIIVRNDAGQYQVQGPRG